MKAEMKRRWPEEPLAAGKRDLSRERRKRAVKVTEGCRRVRCSAYATKLARSGVGDWGVVVDGGGRSGHENSARMNR